MSSTVLSAVKDVVSELSPWNTRVVIHNECDTPVALFLAHDYSHPRPEDAHEFWVPANTGFLVNSGWLREPRATLLVRTGLHEAKVVRAANSCRIVVSLAGRGLKVESPESANFSIEDFADAAAVRGLDTAPMVMHNEHFSDIQPASGPTVGRTLSQPARMVQTISEAARSARDAVAAVSPWNTRVIIHNQCNTPMLVFLAHDAENPRPEQAQKYVLPPNTDYSIHSGWLHEPHATLLIRTGVREAKVIHAVNGARLVVSLAGHGLKVESEDTEVSIEDFADAAAVHNYDTVPMVLHGEHFTDEQLAMGHTLPEPHTISEAAREAIAAVSPWNTRVVVHNQCNTPVLMFLAHNTQHPRPEDAQKYVVPPNTDYSIHSGWLREPLATLLVRTGAQEAKVIHAANGARLVVSLTAHGLKVESEGEDVGIEDFADAAAVHNYDTVPMRMRGESFEVSSAPPTLLESQRSQRARAGGDKGSNVAQVASHAAQNVM